MTTARYVGVWLLGGLGNQMFQYAAGYALSKHLQADLLLDVSCFEHYKLRNYRLGEFNISHQFWGKKSPAKMRRKLLLAKRYITKFGLLARDDYDVLYEEHFHFSDSFFSQKENCYLWGYWQSPKYFSKYEEELRQIFDLSLFESPEIATELLAAEKDNSVSVHVRRGDYTNTETNLVHGICDIDYYERARNLILACNPEATFLIFSDDPVTASDMFCTWPNTKVVSCATDIQEMLVMSRCKHHIIANSSFSWWAAWLGVSEGGSVIAPKKWFARDKMIDTYVLDLFPEEWVLC